MKLDSEKTKSLLRAIIRYCEFSISSANDDIDLLDKAENSDDVGRILLDIYKLQWNAATIISISEKIREIIPPPKYDDDDD